MLYQNPKGREAASHRNGAIFLAIMTVLAINVLAINESWLDASIHDNEIQISDYEIVRRDRSACSVNGKCYGGVCFYVRSSINFSLRLDLSSHQLEN